MPARLKGPILLLITAILWGMAFVAQTAASQDVQPFTFNASRNLIGALFLTGVIAVRKRTGADKPPQAQAPARRGASADAEADASANADADASGSPHAAGGASPAGYSKRDLVVGGIACGIVLFASSFLQQAGITAYPDDTAASGRSGFITALYMVFVALFGLFAGKRPHPLVFAATAVALAGMWLLCVPDGFDGLYIGDVLVFACALGYALHIIVIDRYTRVDGVRLSRVQLITSASLSLVCMALFERPDLSTVLLAAIPILYAGICSDGIAYTFQIIAQQTTDPTVASVLMSLESVFAALGGWLVLSEALAPVELAGCVLVFAAVMLAQVPDFMDNARRKRAEGRQS